MVHDEEEIRISISGKTFKKLDFLLSKDWAKIRSCLSLGSTREITWDHVIYYLAMQYEEKEKS